VIISMDGFELSGETCVDTETVDTVEESTDLGAVPDNWVWIENAPSDPDAKDSDLVIAGLPEAIRARLSDRCKIGPPQETPKRTVSELMEAGIWGIYFIEVEEDTPEGGVSKDSSGDSSGDSSEEASDA